MNHASAEVSVISAYVMQRTGDANFTAQPDLLTQYLQLVLGLPTNSAIQVSPSARAPGTTFLLPSWHHGFDITVKRMLQTCPTLHCPPAGVLAKRAVPGAGQVSG